MATRRLYRSRNGEILGVCKGIAEWRDYPVDTIRLIVVLIAIFTAIAPCLVIYFILGLVLPVNLYEDENYERGYRDGQKAAGKEDREDAEEHTTTIPSRRISSEPKPRPRAQRTMREERRSPTGTTASATADSGFESDDINAGLEDDFPGLFSLSPR